MADTYICGFCSESRTKENDYCRRCNTKQARREQIVLQMEIDAENEKKGYKIPETMFGVPRNELLAEYDLSPNSPTMKQK